MRVLNGVKSARTYASSVCCSAPPPSQVVQQPLMVKSSAPATTNVTTGTIIARFSMLRLTPRTQVLIAFGLYTRHQSIGCPILRVLCEVWDTQMPTPADIRRLLSFARAQGTFNERREHC